jgi:O-acetyl-ADP-ribose deacetylase (regulator of RNase III)
MSATGRKRTYQFGQSTLTLEFGDITTSTAPALVSSDDYYLSMGGGVSRAILRAGGQSIALEAAKAAPAALGEVVVTSAGQLPARHVFHAVTIGPEGRSVDVRTVLARIIPRCFQIMDALDVRSVAFPAIGTGVAGFPLDEVAAVMAELIVSELESRSHRVEVTIYLMDRSGKLGPSDYIVFFEQFASHVPRVAAHAITEPLPVPTSETAPTQMLATTAEQVRAQRFHQIYSLLAQLNEHRYRLDQLLIQQSASSNIKERTRIEERLAQNEQIKRRLDTELEEMNRPDASATLQPAVKISTVFVSSTYEDLKEYRAAVKDQITKRGLLFKGMELFGADPEKTATLSVEEVRQADAFIGIMGLRYGSIDGATGLSMTELEFNAARAAGKKMLLYVLDGEAAVLAKNSEQTAEGHTKLAALRTQVMREHVVAKFKTPDDLAGKVYADLGKLTRGS